MTSQFATSQECVHNALLPKGIARRIWINWYQGFSGAPFVVQKCVESWIEKNPTWEVVLLDENNIGDHIDGDAAHRTRGRLTFQQRSDLLRLALLEKHGGVWADATTFCTIPLDEWLGDYCASGFFAFRNPGKDRVLSSWFLAAAKDCPIIGRLHEKLRVYWLDNNFPPINSTRRIIIDWLSSVLNKDVERPRYWFHPFVRKILRVSPYFAFHYMFERVVSTDDECRAVWAETKPFSADIPHIVQKMGFFTRTTDDVLKRLRAGNAPLLKLRWKYNPARYGGGSLIHYVLEGENSPPANN